MKMVEFDDGFYINLEKINSVTFSIGARESYKDNNVRYNLKLELDDGGHRYVDIKEYSRLVRIFEALGLIPPPKAAHSN